jgi:hypothetical protein
VLKNMFEKKQAQLADGYLLAVYKVRSGASRAVRVHELMLLAGAHLPASVQDKPE